MSVINKMLRDLDQRNSEPAAERKHTISVDTTHIAPPRRKPGGSHAALAAILLSLLVLAGGAWWGWQQLHPVNSPTVSTPVNVATAATPASAPVAVVSAPVAAEPVTAPVPTPEPAASIAVPSPAVAAPVVTAASINTPLKLETTLKLPKSAKEMPAEPATHPAPAPAPLAAGQRLLQAGREAQAQAQALWNSGAKDAAIDLLQQAVGNLERGMATESLPGQLPLLSALVRDLTRMQLADGRAGAAWDLLVRLEPLIRSDPDLWAVRGNAAQRLGRHQDSAHAYLAALQSRPNEQRWLLGAAVSLAASGQTAAAAEMADKARAVGGISPEVQAYLRQAGVPLRDK